MSFLARARTSVLLLLLVLLAAWLAREALQARLVPLDPAGGSQAVAGDPERWFSIDPDGLYHLRRIERARAEPGLPSSFDDYLNAPDGAVVPWPPYYTMVASAFADQSGGRLPLEQSAAELPFHFSLMTAILVAATAAVLAGRLGLLAAGFLFAFSYGSIHYAAPGVADHHAWVSLLATLLLVLFTLSAHLGLFAVPRRAALAGAFAGTVAGVLLGSWVGAVLYVLPLQLALAWWLHRMRDERRPGLLLFGFLFHALALAALLPAVLQSPWKVEQPWMVVNLSWFHVAWLGLGGLVFLPPFLLRGARATALYLPGLVVGGGILAAAIVLLDVGPAAGLREAFAWSSRADRFMASIAESSPLWGTDEYASGGFARWIGFGVLLLPLGLWWGGRAVLRRGEEAWVPLLIAVPLLLLQALAQRRFAEPLAAPLALLVAWTLVEVLRSRPKLLPRPAALQGLAVIGFALLMQASTVVHVVNRAGSSRFDPVQAAERRVLEWLATAADAPPLGPGDGLARAPVLAGWDLGHALEWVAQRPSIASNFGSYIGLDSYQAPARFMLAEDHGTAEGILRAREVGWVLVTSRYPDLLKGLCTSLGLPLGRYQEAVGEGGGRRMRFAPGFFSTVGAQVFNLGDMDGPAGPAPPIPFLRLVHVSPLPVEVPEQLGGVTAAARVWQVVRGARVEARLAPGARLRVSIPFRFDRPDGSAFLRGTWQQEVFADTTGLAAVRVPYATDRNLDAVVHDATWQVDDGPPRALTIAESAVLAGTVVELR